MGHWILIAVFVTSATGGGSKGFAFQEFGSKAACEKAKLAAITMSKTIVGSADVGREYALDCVPK